MHNYFLKSFIDLKSTQNITLTAVSSDSRPPNPKCLTAIIVFDIWAQSLILQQGMFLLNFGEKCCILCLFSSCEILVCYEFEFGVFYWIDDRTWMSKTIIDVKYFEFRWSRITRNCCKYLGLYVKHCQHAFKCFFSYFSLLYATK